MNDGKLVSRLRNGSNMTIATIDRVRTFLRAQLIGRSPSRVPASTQSSLVTPKRRKRPAPAPKSTSGEPLPPLPRNEAA